MHRRVVDSQPSLLSGQCKRGIHPNGGFAKDTRRQVAERLARPFFIMAPQPSRYDSSQRHFLPPRSAQD
jgi:hypothetical protein